MQQAEFDGYVEVYEDQHQASISMSGETPAYFADYKIRALADMCAEWGTPPESILDFGSGMGNSLPGFRKYFPQSAVTAADVSSESLVQAQLRHGDQEAQMVLENGRIPAMDDSFDLSFTACVFHHIPEDEHISWLTELRRVTRPGGRLVIFEHNPLNPLTLHAVKNCPFDENAVLIQAREMRRRMAKAGWSVPKADFHVFFPAALSGLRSWEPKLKWCPLGAQYAAYGQA